MTILEIWVISKFILDKVSSNIYPSLLLMREGEKPHAFAGLDTDNNVERCFRSCRLWELCFGKKQDPGAVAAEEMAALCNQMLSFQSHITNCPEVQRLDLKWIILKGQFHSTYSCGIWPSRKLKLLMILIKEGSIPERKSSSVNSPRDWRTYLYTLARDL